MEEHYFGPATGVKTKISERFFKNISTNVWWKNMMQLFLIGIFLQQKTERASQDQLEYHKQQKLTEVITEAICLLPTEWIFNQLYKQRNFVIILAAKREANGFKVVLCPSDADTTIFKAALEYENWPVTIFADDTYILCLLLYHLYIWRDYGDIYLKIMTGI